jgi:hypothetical protein
MRLVVWEFYSRTTIGDAGSSRSPRPMYFMGRVIAISLQENHRREKQVTGYVRLMPQRMVSRGGPELAKHLASSVRSASALSNMILILVMNHQGREGLVLDSVDILNAPALT